MLFLPSQYLMYLVVIKREYLFGELTSQFAIILTSDHKRMRLLKSRGKKSCPAVLKYRTQNF